MGVQINLIDPGTVSSLPAMFIDGSEDEAAIGTNFSRHASIKLPSSLLIGITSPIDSGRF